MPLILSIFRPILAALIRDRRVTVVLAGLIALQLGLALLEVPGWQCPTMAVLGQPCPGCGLTRAVVALLHFDIGAALRLHAFAPLAILSAGVVGIAAVLPSPHRDAFVDLIERGERKTGLTGWVLIGFMLYWLARLCLVRPSLVGWVAS